MSLGRLAQQAKQCLRKRAEHSQLNAFVPSTTNQEAILLACQAADERQATGNPLSSIDGQLVAIKDNICTSEQPTTCGSQMLQGFQSPFSATVVEKLNAAGAVIAGKTNLDEFGMGSHTVNSIHGPVKSGWSGSGAERTVGGSSGGSALAVATGQCFAALGTDTGGSVRLPAAWTGTVGFKPSYGMISRWGVVAYANSLDTVGVLTRTVEAAKQVYEQIKGHDPKDPTSISRASIARETRHQIPSNPIRIGIPSEYILSELRPSIRTAWSRAIKSLQRNSSFSIHHISLPFTKSALSAYYILAPAEASSNLAKYDGVRYGNKAPSSSPGRGNDALFSQTRYRNFGAEVRRRVLLGSYTLSSTAINNYFIRAQRIRRLVQQDFNRVFDAPHPFLPLGRSKYRIRKRGVDVIICPTSLNLPPLLSELRANHERDPASQFYEDIYTVPASLAGLPAVSVPAPRAEGAEEWENVGLQVMGQYGDDELVLDVARDLEAVGNEK
ncbi:MAG: hypothetical protein Q9170_008179 [Blastenia crenularia]